MNKQNTNSSTHQLVSSDLDMSAMAVGLVESVPGTTSEVDCNHTSVASSTADAQKDDKKEKKKNFKATPYS